MRRVLRQFLLSIITAALLCLPVSGAVVIDGNLSEWSEIDRLDTGGFEGPPGTELYGRYEDENFYFAIKSPSLVDGSYTKVWINSDRDSSTGYLIWGFAGGIEAHVHLDRPHEPVLLAGDDQQDPVGPVPFAYGDGTVEFSVPSSSLPGVPESVSILVDLNDSIFLPFDYSLHQFVVERMTADDPLPDRTDFSRRVGIVYSESTAKNFYDQFAYSQLFMSMQHHSMMAGVPFDILTEEDLLDISNIVNYDALILPLFSHVKAANAEAIAANLAAAQEYGTGLITSGNFMSNDETGAVLPGYTYERMKSVFGLAPTYWTGPVIASLDIAPTDHPALGPWSPGENVAFYPIVWIGEYAGVEYEPLAYATTPFGQIAAVQASDGANRTVHFANDQFMADANLLWPAIRWVTGDENMSLMLSRNDGMLFSRCDMDQSMIAEEVPVVEVPLYDILSEWKEDYGFVGSFYINIGNNRPAGEYTNWKVSRPLYKKYMSLGNEIATHSYTHPDHISLLTDDELRFEFYTSNRVISKRLKTIATGAAVPGNAESFETADKLDRYLTYVSGRFSAVGSGYPGGFGYLIPGHYMIYFSLNMLPDFTYISWLEQSSEQAAAGWREAIAQLSDHAAQPLIHWMWHDYGPTEREPGYTEEMFESTVKEAHDRGFEFITGKDLEARIRAFGLAKVHGTLDSKVSGINLGKFSLQAPGNIESVDGWYAYSGDRVFLPENGGEFKVTLGDTPAAVTRITALPQRARLVSVTGDGSQLSFTLVGEGTVEVTLADERPFKVEGAKSWEQVGDVITIDLKGSRLYSCTVSP